MYGCWTLVIKRHWNNSSQLLWQNKLLLKHSDLDLCKVRVHTLHRVECVIKKAYWSMYFRPFQYLIILEQHRYCLEALRGLNLFLAIFHKKSIHFLFLKCVKRFSKFYISTAVLPTIHIYKYSLMFRKILY